MTIRKTIYLAMASLIMSATFAASADAATPRQQARQQAARHHSAARHHAVMRHHSARHANRARPARGMAMRQDNESSQVDALNQQSLNAARGGAAAQ